MLSNPKSRKLTTAMLALALMVWGTAAMAAPMEAPAMQCSMSAHDMGDMPCCPGDAAQQPSSSSHGTCCELGQAPERPTTFVVSAEPSKSKVLDVVAVLPATTSVPAAELFGAPGTATTPQYARPVLELKTDLRI